MSRRTIRIFLASPWDTAEARQVVADVAHDINRDALTRDTLQIELLRWDDPDKPVPCSFLHNPQADVVATTGSPGDCDLVIGLFRHVFGSPLPVDNYGHSPDGDAWTGTEWEIHRAIEAARAGALADVMVFRDTEAFELPAGLTREDRRQRYDQYDAVCAFFEACKEPGTASILRGVNTHDGLAPFRESFEPRLKAWIKARLSDPRPAAPVESSAPKSEPLTPEQQRLLDILLTHDEPLDRALVATVYKAQVHGLRGYLLHRFAAWCVAGRQLDQQFVNLDLMIDHGPQHDGQRFEPVRHASLQALLAAEPDTRGWVLIGEPGSGKSTVLQHHELLMARAGLRALARGEPLPELCLWQRLADCPHDVADPAAWLTAQWQRLYPALPAPDELARTHRLRWLLDGLNEVQAPTAEAFRAATGRWAAWAAALPADRSAAPIFSVRTLDYSATLSSEGLTVRQARLAPWSLEQIERFCLLRLGPDNTLAPAIRKDQTLTALCALPFNLDAQCSLTGALGRPAADRAELFGGMAWQRLRRAKQRRELEHPGLLTDREHAQLADEGYWLDHLHQLPAKGQLVAGLDRQATRMHRASDGTEVSVDEDEVVPWLAAQSDRRAWLGAVQALHIAEVELSGRFRYTHQLWQEFHAARGLRDLPLKNLAGLPDLRAPEPVGLDEAVRALAAQDPLPGPGVSAWEESVKLAVQMAARLDDGGAAVAAWIDHLSGVNLALAGRAALRGMERLTSSPRLEALRAALLKRSRDPAVDLRLRIEAGEVLGDLGDPRFEERVGPHGRYLWPRQWVTVPAGRYVIGSEDGIRANETPLTPVELTEFSMAFAPVTNAEFRCFIEAGGYEDERWWEGETAQRWRREGIHNEQSINEWRTWLAALRENFDEGQRRHFPDATESYIKTDLKVFADWSAEQAEENILAFFAARVYREPGFWWDARFNRASKPVVGITVFEAQAYAQWLAAQSGQTIRLPAEAEWEAAARLGTGRRWPWGETDPGRWQMNADPAHLREPSPIGVFVEGETPEGLSDMAGNILEWTTSAYTVRLKAQEVKAAATDGMARRVLRGGSWDLATKLCRAPLRDRDSPVVRLGSLGLRLVLGPIQSPEP